MSAYLRRSPGTANPSHLLILVGTLIWAARVDKQYCVRKVSLESEKPDEFVEIAIVIVRFKLMQECIVGYY